MGIIITIMGSIIAALTVGAIFLQSRNMAIEKRLRESEETNKELMAKIKELTQDQYNTEEDGTNKSKRKVPNKIDFSNVYLR